MSLLFPLLHPHVQQDLDKARQHKAAQAEKSAQATTGNQSASVKATESDAFVKRSGDAQPDKPKSNPEAGQKSSAFNNMDDEMHFVRWLNSPYS